MSGFWIAVLAVLVLVLALTLLWLRRRAAPEGEHATNSDRLDTLAAWPPEAARVLTTAERQAYAILLRALPDHMLLAQVPLARFLKVPKRNSYAEWLRRLGNQCVDLVVCDMGSQVIAVIDVQAPAGQATERSRKRLNRIARSLKAAGIPLHVWTEGELPSVQAARETVLPSVNRGSELTTQPAPLSEVPEPAAPARMDRTLPSPFDDTGRDSAQDELIELREAPPSTWFDDIDSTPVPLTTPKPKR